MKKIKKTMVIVESPTKARTITRILGDDFVIYSSMGHLIDLPKSRIGVDIEDDFKPTYVIIPGKKKALTQLKKEAKRSEIIYLATDPDREGEAISWHLMEQLRAKTNGQKFLRVVFHEITPEAVKAAFEHPRSLDIDKVNAQQARRVLDRIVGYLLSPLLWKKVARGLSAGRVQSVALKLIVDREREIRAFKPEEYWSVEAELKQKPEESLAFLAQLDKRDNEKLKISSQEEGAAIVADLERAEYVVGAVKKGKKNRHPYPPFITSTLQQAAFNRLKYTSQKTMLLAQQLYEGVELGSEGSTGIITYMRTDSVKIADSAVKSIREFIGNEFGEQYLTDKPRVYRSKKSAQEAHEAIRPTSVSRRPELIREFLNDDQFRLYQLIWQRAVASQMESAVYSTSSVEITAGRYGLSSSGSILAFEGFLKVYGEDVQEKDSKVPEVFEGEPLDLLNLKPEQHFTRPPARYSEASLIRLLEEKGIGRPSTYAPIIFTLTSRDYVRREKGYLACTELGMKVNDILVEYFSDIVDEGFTASMEEELDQVEDGKLNWVNVLKNFYDPFKQKVTYAQEHLQKEVIETDEVCELCGRPMVIKWSRRGKFLSCSGFPECRNAKSISLGVKCPSPGCEGELVARSSRRGARFYGCTKYPECRYMSKFLPKQEKKEETEAAGEEK